MEAICGLSKVVYGLSNQIDVAQPPRIYEPGMLAVQSGGNQMYQRQWLHKSIICGSLLLVSLLLEVSGITQARTAAQAINAIPANHIDARISSGAIAHQSSKQVSRTTYVNYDLLPPSLQNNREYGHGTSCTGRIENAPAAPGFWQDALKDFASINCPIYSDFNGSAVNWVSHTGDWDVNDNYLYTYGVENSWSSESYTANFEDFDYQVRMMRVGCATCANNIAFRGTPDPLDSQYLWHTSYLFQYRRDGRYSVWKIDSGSYQALIGSTYSGAINQGDAWNTLRVIAKGTRLAFYMNGTFLASLIDASFSGGRVGVMLYRDTDPNDVLYVDWAHLCELANTIYLPSVHRN